MASPCSVGSYYLHVSMRVVAREIIAKSLEIKVSVIFEGLTSTRGGVPLSSLPQFSKSIRPSTARKLAELSTGVKLPRSEVLFEIVAKILRTWRLVQNKYLPFMLRTRNRTTLCSLSRLIIARPNLLNFPARCLNTFVPFHSRFSTRSRFF